MDIIDNKVLNYIDYGNIQKIIKYHKLGYRFDKKCMSLALLKGHVDIIKYLHEKCGINISDDKFDKIYVDFGYLEVVKYLDKSGIKFGYRDLDTACYRGHIELVKYFNNHHNMLRNYIDSPKFMDSAASGGHFDIVKYLHENGAKCTGYAIDWAACRRNIELVKFLHNIDTKPSYMATYLASRDGDMEMVKYLISIDAPKSTSAMDYAAANGHLDIVKYLHEMSFNFTDNALLWSRQNGHDSVSDYLHGIRQ